MATELGLAARLRQAHEYAEEHAEGPIARTIEDHTAPVPADQFLWAALGSVGLSLALFGAGRKHDAMFVGQWAAPILAFGLYRKMARHAESDELDR